MERKRKMSNAYQESIWQASKYAHSAQNKQLLQKNGMFHMCSPLGHVRECPGKFPWIVLPDKGARDEHNSMLLVLVQYFRSLGPNT